MIKNEKQTLGEFFQEARKEKVISIDEIVRDTNIPKRYLESIESDNFDVFPGETYAMGFISNYAEALEVDKELAISMYKKQMKIEQDSPIEQLVGKKRQLVLINNNILIVSGIAAAAILIILLITIAIRGGSDGKGPQIKNYLFTFNELNNIAIQKFRVGDSITVSNEAKSIFMQLDSISPSKSLILRINNTEHNIKNGTLTSIDSDNNGTNDMVLELISAKAKEIKLSITDLKEGPGGGTNQIVDDVYDKYKEYILSETELFTAASKTSVDMKIQASGYGWVNYNPDSKEEKDVYLNSGTIIPVSFSSHLVLFLGNSGAVKIIANNKEEAGGGWGEVSKSIFYWKDKNGQFALVRAILK